LLNRGNRVMRAKNQNLSLRYRWNCLGSTRKKWKKEGGGTEKRGKPALPLAGYTKKKES